jgi:hypothetical protein
MVSNDIMQKRWAFVLSVASSIVFGFVSYVRFSIAKYSTALQPDMPGGLTSDYRDCSSKRADVRDGQDGFSLGLFR